MFLKKPSVFEIVICVSPYFNIAATMSFVDPFRAVNYLDGMAGFGWTLVSPEGGVVPASSGVEIVTRQIDDITDNPQLCMVSTSWTPEKHAQPALVKTLRKWARFGSYLGGIDTGAFVLAEAGLLKGYRATVHYEHMASFSELFPGTDLTEELYTIDRDRLSTCGGMASVDLALQLIAQLRGQTTANAAARFVYHDRLRLPGEEQISRSREPLGISVPNSLHEAIRCMERNLEEPLTIPEVARQAGLSQRQLERLFHQYVRRTPLEYYRDIRLDRARGLVTQTRMKIRDIGIASGFASPEHFSRSYSNRFGVSPVADRIEGRVPFEFRAWPMAGQARKSKS